MRRFYKLLELKSVTKRYSVNSVPAVFDLNLNVNNGEIFGFIGPNGAGKTTTIKMITGLLEPTEGDVIINGYNMKTNPIECKRMFGYVPDNPEIYERLTGAEYLNFMADVYGVSSKDRKERINKYIDMFDIANAVNQSIKSYSRGMRQKLAITGALIHEPKLWILDEPMVGLDPMSAKVLKDEMKNHCNKGNTVFFSTHILEVAEKLCDRVGIINSSELVAVGTVEGLKAKSNNGDSSLEDVFIKIVDSEN